MSSIIINDIYEAGLKNINDWPSYDIICDASYSKIDMEGDISDKL